MRIPPDRQSPSNQSVEMLQKTIAEQDLKILELAQENMRLRQAFLAAHNPCAQHARVVNAENRQLKKEVTQLKATYGLRTPSPDPSLRTYLMGNGFGIYSCPNSPSPPSPIPTTPRGTKSLPSTPTPHSILAPTPRRSEQSVEAVTAQVEQMLLAMTDQLLDGTD